MRAILSLFALIATLLVVSDVPAQFPQQGGGQQGGGKKGKGGGGQGGAQGGPQGATQGMIIPGGGKGGQGGNPFGGGKSPFGGGGLSKDSANVFEMLAKGKPYFMISETRTLRGPLSAFAKEQGITNDQITREQFNTFYAKMDQYSGAGGGGGRQNFGPGGEGFTPPPGSPPIAPGQDPLQAIAQWAEADFKRRDINGDGRLVPEEMSDQLRNQLDRWDTDHDGLISLDEYKVYYSARLQMRDGAPDQQPNPVSILIEEDYDRRPDVIRAGKLPKELPRWFGELDTDQDGQVALHEWFKAGKEIDEFKEWDRNDDGLLTAEEVLFHMKANGISTASNGNRGPGGTSMGDRAFGRGPGEWNGIGGGESGGEGRPKGKKDGGGGMADFFKKKKGGG